MLDDIIVWWVGEERFDVMPNASNTEQGDLGRRRRGRDRRAGVIAVQGPRARERLATVSPEAAAVGHFAVGDFEFEGRTVPRRRHRLHRRGRRRVRRAGRDRPGLLAGGRRRRRASPPVSGARHAPARGGPATSRPRARRRHHAPCRPVSAGSSPGTRARSGAASRWSASGRPGPWRRLRGLLAEGRRPPRNEDAVLVGGEVKGVVTSGNFSPVLQRGIALAFLPPETAMGAEVEIELRGGRVPAVVVKPPFQKLTVVTTGDDGGSVRAAGPSS